MCPTAHAPAGPSTICETATSVPRPACGAGAIIGAAGFDWKSSGSTILPGAAVKGRLRIRPRVDGSMKIGRYEIYVDGRRIVAAQPAEELEVPTASLGDGRLSNASRVT